MDDNQYRNAIILTTKDGTSNETRNIERLSYDPKTCVYKVRFKNGSEYHFSGKNVRIEKNALRESAILKRFNYLLQMAEYSDIKNEDDENLLVKNFKKTEFVNESSALGLYLNNSRVIKTLKHDDLIFPFGSNNSQYQAVETALSRQLSIIQGPPGTGKTQTILNIIANLLVQHKTVLVVSNNNAATENVAEKLSSEKYGMDFLCATLGRKENIDDFINNQTGVYPEYIKEWRKLKPLRLKEINARCRELGNLFDNNERISTLNHEIDELVLEKMHYEESNGGTEYYDIKRIGNSSFIMQLWQKLQQKYNGKERLGFFTTLKLQFLFGFWASRGWDTNPEKIFVSLKMAYYNKVIEEKRNELAERKNRKFNVVPNEVYQQSLDYMKKSLAEKYDKDERIKFQNSRDLFVHFDDLIDEYPIILSTTFSSRHCIPSHSVNGFYDYVIMDEASQVDVVTGALALSCAENAVIVGDKMQLPNVITEEKRKIIKEEFLGSGVLEGYNFEHSFLESIERLFPEVPQTLLREHYRCHPKIINFCNQKFYGGKLLIMTEDKEEDDVLTAMITVPGNHCSDFYNQRQIDVIKEEILPALEKDNVDTSTIGVVAPYNNQVDQLKKQLPLLDSATVHKFQGREKDTIIISTVDNKISPFTDDAKMLNVAISRAKKKLYVIVSGNEQDEHSNIMELVKYIQYNNFSVQESNVNSIFDCLYSNYTKERFAYISKIKKISKYDSENIMYDLLCKILKEDEFQKFGVVFEMPLKDIVSQSGMELLDDDLKLYASRSWSHCDFTIYNKITKAIVCGIEVDGYTYHKKGTVQSERDKKKDEIFKTIGIPLLRCSTKGSEQENLIREEFRKF